MGGDLDGAGCTGILHVADTAFAIDPAQVLKIQYVRSASPEKGISPQDLLNSTEILCNDLRMAPRQMQVRVAAIGLAIDNVFRIDQQISRPCVQLDP